MVTAAGVAHSNRIPLLLIAGDTFASRLPDPVLQQVEHFGEPSTTVNDAFRSVSRYWDRIMKPEQVVSSLPHAVQTMLDPADCGPAFIGLPQDVAAEAYDFPVRFFDEQIHHLTRQRADIHQLDSAAAAIENAEKPLIIAGGGVHYSFAEAELAAFAETHNIPVVETVAGKASLLATPDVRRSDRCHRLRGGQQSGRRGRCRRGGRHPARGLHDRLVDRLQECRRQDRRHQYGPLGRHQTPGPSGRRRRTRSAHRPDRSHRGLSSARVVERHGVGRGVAVPRLHDKIAAPDANGDELPSYAQVVGVVDRLAGPDDFALAAAGGFPGEVNNGWRQKALNSFDCEYGFSCMGYEISGGWGAAMALPDKDVTVFVGDGSYLMMNSDLYSSVLSGHKMIVIVCDNGGFAVINRLQVNQGGAPFNNLLADSKIVEEVRVDFAAHAAAMGCNAETVSTIDELEAAWKRPRKPTARRSSPSRHTRIRGPRAAHGGRSVCPRCRRTNRCVRPELARRGQGRSASRLVAL